MNLKKMSLSTLAIIASAICFNFLLVATEARAASTIIRTSAAAENKSFWIDYRSYPFVSNWPKKNEGCGGTATQKKTMPWLGDSNEPLKTAIDSRTGNYIGQSGNCSDRYVDGGTASEAWIPATDYGNWASPGPNNWPQAITIRNSAATACDSWDYDLCTGWFTDTPQIWGMDHRFGRLVTEQVDHFKDLYNRINTKDYAGAQNGFFLFSSGTTLLRNEFTLTQEEINQIKSVDIKVKADDFAKIYINGVAFASDGVAWADISINNGDTAILRNLLIPGQNVIALQVSDKARWTQQVTDASGNKISTSRSNAAGAWYNVTFNLTPPPACTLGAPGPFASFTTSSAGGSTSVNMTATSSTNGLNANLVINYQRAGMTTWNQFSPAAGVNPSLMGTSNPPLTAGAYYFNCAVRDSSSVSYTSPDRTFYVVDPIVPPPPPLSCNIRPTGGDLPLVVTISASGGTAPYSYYDNGASVPGSSSSINRTITDTIAHVYTIRDSAGVTAPPCSTVTANSNSDGTGNEVAP